jgi:hypothetical protein
VDGSHAARRSDLQPIAHRVDELVVGSEQVEVAEMPGGLLPQDARGFAGIVELDDPALDLEVAVPPERARPN